MSQDRSLAVGEESVAILHPHWKTLVVPVLLTFVVVAVLLMGEVLIPGNKWAAIERLALAVVAIVLLMWWLMYPILVWHKLPQSTRLGTTGDCRQLART